MYYYIGPTNTLVITRLYCIPGLYTYKPTVNMWFLARFADINYVDLWPSNTC